MKKNSKTKQQLLLEMEELRTRLNVAEQRLEEANELMEAEVTERKRAEEAFARAQKHAESIVETIREPLLVLTADLKVISANQSFYQTFKVKPEETEGRFIYSIGNHQWDIPALRKLLEEIVPQNSKFIGFEVDHEFPVIGRKMMLLNARRIYRQGKGTEMILLAIEDITERNQARKVLEVSETRYRRLFETAQDGILILDADTGQISDVNPFLIQMLGYPHEDFLGRHLWEIGAFKDIEASRTAFSELQTKGYVRYENLPLQTRDGRFINVEFVSNVYLVDHHKVIQCNIRDITKRKEAEEALQEKTHELGERVKELNCLYALFKIIERPDISLPEAFEGAVNIIPPGWQYPEVTCARLVFENQIFKTPNFNETIWKQSSPILVDRRTVGTLEVYYLEERPKCDEGPFLKQERDLIDALASRLGKAIQRWEAEGALREKEVKLERLNKELEAFSYSVSHDLRTPLIGINGLSGKLLDTHAPNLDEKGQHFLRLIRGEAQSMLQLIGDVMAFSRVKHQEVKLSPIDMVELARIVVNELKTIMPKQGLTVDIKTLPPARGDHTMIRQAFFNLLSNAIKFTKPKEAGMIEIGFLTGENEHIYYVKDNGIGFDMQYVAKLFEVFQRLHSADEFEGTGVGLAIVQRIIERHGGRVWAEGRVDEGATFYFTLPRREERIDP